MKIKKSYQIKSGTALALFSGGLDSILAVRIIQKLGITIIPVCFSSPFFDCKKAKISSEILDLELQTYELGEEYLNIIKNPKYGYGKHLNPCIDCHAFMYRKLGEMMSAFKSDFLISGEVLGQRPKSQSITGLNTVAKHCGYKNIIVRPLCQKLLQDTKPIREGWINKDELYDIQGKSRKRQIELAKEFKITNYPSPAGGCLLTDEGYCKKLNDLIIYDMFSLKYIKFLNVGRHFRVSENTKFILGRKKIDNDKLQELITDDLFTIRAVNFPGPLGVINYNSKVNIEEVELCAKILLRYITKIKDRTKVRISIGNKQNRIIEEKKIEAGLEKNYLIN
ncbi:MAG: DUF814 domain-containing protein [Candidatus Cloacimonetes bacterium]|nr:DUF814 domain-containing protein [Candidatus Cloacimonadota bacterium]